jgi:hypothetical protein
VVDRIVIDDAELAHRIQGIARQERRSVREVLTSMVTQYQPQESGDDQPDAEALARRVRLAAYRRARAYWQANGDEERAALTDKQLDEAFWLFDTDGTPRLKADRDQVKFPKGSLHVAGKILAGADYHSGQSDIGSRSREILNNEFANYILTRANRPVEDDSPSID